MDRAIFESNTVPSLRKVVAVLQLVGFSRKTKAETIDAIMAAMENANPEQIGEVSRILGLDNAQVPEAEAILVSTNNAQVPEREAFAVAKKTPSRTVKMTPGQLRAARKRLHAKYGGGFVTYLPDSAGTSIAWETRAGRVVTTMQDRVGTLTVEQR